MLYFIDIKQVMRIKKVIMTFKMRRKKMWGIIPYLCSRNSFNKKIVQRLNFQMGEKEEICDYSFIITVFTKLDDFME